MRGSKLVVVLLALSCVAYADEQHVSLGLPATAEDIAKVYWSITPDGENLPPGKGTAKQGEPLYVTHCSGCHGEGGKGNVARALVGGAGSLQSKQPVKSIGSYWPYATTVFDYVRRSIPYTAPMSLSNDEYYAITAYLLHINGIISRNQAIGAKSLPKVKMPNRDGFVLAYHASRSLRLPSQLSADSKRT